MELPEAALQFQEELIAAAVAHGLGEGFGRSGKPNLPWIEGALLICPGGLLGSWAGHRCRFVSVEGQWCFEHKLVLADVVEREKGRLFSVTVLPASEGLLVEAVSARSRGSVHMLVEAVGWRVVKGELLFVGRRKSGKYPLPGSHLR